MRQSWRDLLFLHWEVGADQIRQKLPPGLMLDTFDGKAYIGLVPFRMRHLQATSPLILPLAHTIDEVNVRTYVHRAGRHPGVWFFSLDASTLPAVIGARIGFKLPYFLSRFHITRGAQGSVEYASRRIGPPPVPAGCDIAYSRFGDEKPAEPGTLAHFLVERYILYSFHYGRLYSAYVNHIPYPLQDARVTRLRENLIEAAGIERIDSPPIVNFSRGVDPGIHRLQRAE